MQSRPVSVPGEAKYSFLDHWGTEKRSFPLTNNRKLLPATYSRFLVFPECRFHETSQLPQRRESLPKQ